MTQMARFGGPQPMPKLTVKSAKGEYFIDYKDVENLRRVMSPNGKLYGRKRAGMNARQQRMLAQAIKRARFLSLLPYTSATL